MAKSGNTMWNGSYGADESKRRQSYQRTAQDHNTPAGRRQIRQELLSGKEKYESSLPKSNVVVPIEFIEGAVKRKMKE
jgi:hypothetical protein